METATRSTEYNWFNSDVLLTAFAERVMAKDTREVLEEKSTKAQTARLSLGLGGIHLVHNVLDGQTCTHRGNNRKFKQMVPTITSDALLTAPAERGGANEGKGLKEV